MTNPKTDKSNGVKHRIDLSKVEINKEHFKKVAMPSENPIENTMPDIDGQTSIFYWSPTYSPKFKGFPLPSHLALVDPMQGAADRLEFALISYMGFDKHTKVQSIVEAVEEYLNGNWDIVEAANFEAE